jgi:hypothetical protein
LSANATSARVSIHHDTKQCAENVHSENRKAAGKSPTVLAYNYRATGGKNAPCLLPSATFNFAYAYTPPDIYLSVHVAFTSNIFPAIKNWAYFPATNGACSDYTKMDVNVQANVAIEARTSSCAGHCSGFPGYSALASACLGPGPGSTPVRTTPAGCRLECPCLSSQSQPPYL